MPVLFLREISYCAHVVAVYALDICAQFWGAGRIQKIALISGLRKLTELKRRVGWPYFLDIHLAPLC